MRSEIELLSVSGTPEVAEVFAARLRRTPERCFEFVDGLDWRCPREKKWIINVSTQFGCPVGCLFCDAGGVFRGNIPADVILMQIRSVLARYPDRLARECKKLKVHFSRMGEPAYNDEVLRTLEQLPALIPNPDLWACLATVFPKGRTDWFESLLAIKSNLYARRFQLQFSINSTDPACRRRLMPTSLASFEEMAEFGRAFYGDGDRKPVLNFAIARDVPVSPREAARHFDPRMFAVKLTPLNPTNQGAASGLVDALGSSGANPVALADEFRDQGFDVIVSIGDERENEARSNCGQAVWRYRRAGVNEEPVNVQSL